MRSADADARLNRRWQLMSELGNTIGAWASDFATLTDHVADRIQRELCDGCMVILLDPPGSEQPIIGVGHAEAAHAQVFRDEVVDRLTAQDVHAWVTDMANRDRRITGPVGASVEPTDGWQTVLREHVSHIGVGDAGYAPLRGSDGRLRGMILCARDAGASPFDDIDLTTIAGAADSVSLGLDLFATRAQLQAANQRQLEAQREIAALAEQRRVLLGELVNAEQAERLRIAQDVHDDAIQILAATQLRMQVLANRLAPGGAEEQDAERVTELIHGAQRSLRQLLLDLEPSNTSDLPIEESLRDAADLFFNDSGTVVTVAGSLDDLPPDVAWVLYRAGREAISNSRRHAQAGTVRVSLATTEDRWQLTVEDDGAGIPQPVPSEEGHLGLRGMRSRMEAIGGTCAIGPRDGGGTTVRLSVPRQGQPPADASPR